MNFVWTMLRSSNNHASIQHNKSTMWHNDDRKNQSKTKQKINGSNCMNSFAVFVMNSIDRSILAAEIY